MGCDQGWWEWGVHDLGWWEWGVIRGGGSGVVSYPDPNVCKHYRLQCTVGLANTSKEVVLGMSLWNVITFSRHSNGYIITICVSL